MSALNRILPVLLFVGITFFAQGQNVSYDYYDGQLWVQFNPNATSSIDHAFDAVKLNDFEHLLTPELIEAYGVTRIRKPFHFAKANHITEVYQIYFDAIGEEVSFARELEALSAVNYAERVPVMRPTFTPNDLGPEGGNNNQWHLWRINAQDAWDISTGSTQIVVAIVDDAVLVTHPDLAPNLVAGFDVADNDNDPMPNESGMSHGTHVAGIAGSATNNGVGIASIGFNVRIMPVKSSNVAEFISDAYSGVIWAADNGADVINMSWGGSGFSNTGQNIIDYAAEAGCLNVAAAGNDNVSSIFYPAGYASVISVASTTTNDGKSSFSNFGTWIDVAAPGSAIRSTYFNSSFTPNYANLQGTSMASPLVAGLCGLVWSVNPEMTAAQVTDCVLNSTDNINGANPNFIGQLGSGRINAFAAVQCAQATVNAPPVATIASNATVSCPGGLIQFFGSSAGGLATTYNWTFPGGNPGVSNLQNPVVSYSGVGFYEVTLDVSNDFGANTITLPGFIEVSSNGIDIFFTEDFETGSFTEMGWSVDNPDNGLTWALFTVAGSVSGNRAAGVNLFNYEAEGQRDRLISPIIDLSNHTNVQLDFQHAHRRYSQQMSDSLIVYVSVDGGATWPFRILEAAETGQGSFATGTILNQNFVPTNGSDWCFGGEIGSGCFTLDLSDFDGQESVRIRFETFNDYGNNIYIDNIQLSGNCLLVQAAPLAGLTAQNTEVCAGGSVQFIDQSVNVPTSYQWFFPGGQPETASSPAPIVSFPQPGNYSVTLVVSNAFGSDEITFNEYITVNPAPTLILNSTEITSCVGVGVNLNVSGADTYSWAPNLGLSSTIGSSVTATPDETITYTVTGIGGGCSVSESVTVNVLQGPEAPTVVTDDDVAFVMVDPQPVQGFYNFALPAAGWGVPNLANVTLETNLVIARDNTQGDSLLCNPAVNGAQLNGKIAIIYRGGCEFGIKALNAQNAGAVGVIVINNVSGLMEMGPGVNGSNVTIPVIMVSQETGNYLYNALINGEATARLGNFNGGNLLICPGETVELAGPGGWNDYLWSNSSESVIIEVGNAGAYAVTVFDDNGCGTPSINYSVTVAAQAMPNINQNGNTLSAGVGASSYQWFLNGVAIEGANQITLEITEEGTYSVTATNAIGCQATSADYTAMLVGINEAIAGAWKLFPNPASDVLYLEVSDADITQFEMYSSDGRLVLNQELNKQSANRLTIAVSHLASGNYICKLTNSNGISSHQRVMVTR
jgi:PKD repeat protein